jgi:hypothetical protein
MTTTTTIRLMAVLAALALLLAAGCGGDDDEDGGGGEAATTQTTQTTTQAEPTQPDSGSGGAASAAELESCLKEAGLELKPEGTQYTDDKGETKTREKLDMENTEYAGFVQFPSKRVADVYVASDDAAAQAAEREAGTFVKAFGFDPAKYVRRAGTVVMVFDDPPPTEEEAGQVADCAGG